MVSVQQECVRKVAAVHARLSPVISATRRGPMRTLSSTFVLEKKNVKVNTVRMSHAESSEEHTGVRVPAGPGFSIRIRTLLGASVK